MSTGTNNEDNWNKCIENQQALELDACWFCYKLLPLQKRLRTMENALLHFIITL